MIDFDPGAAGSSTLGVFGIPTRLTEARVVLIPVPWEVTTSYGGGTARGPAAVRVASAQVDLYDFELGRAYELGYHLLDEPSEIARLNESLKPRATSLRDAPDRHTLEEVNAGCAQMTEWVREQAREILKRGQIPAVLGGDHSTPEGLIHAVCEATPSPVGLLHIDAHADLRVAYEGFTRSHASIMYNVMRADRRPAKLVQVGIRDFSEDEFTLTQSREDVLTFFDAQIKREIFEGQTWAGLCTRIVSQLPKDVYVSFDIDGLEPSLCPGTGTPVPGGLSFDQANYLIGAVVRSGRRIVGFDLNEVSPRGDDEWDANVGARVLFKLCGWAARSHAAQRD